MTSWHTCLGSSLAAPRSSRFVILYWTKDGILASLGLSPVFRSPLVWLITGLKQVSKFDLLHAPVFEVVKWHEPFQSKVLVSGSDQTLFGCWQQFIFTSAIHKQGRAAHVCGSDHKCTVRNYPLLSLPLAALPEEDLGGFYWRFFCHCFVWIAGK